MNPVVPEVGVITVAQLSEMIRIEAELEPEELQQLPLASRLVVSQNIVWEVGKSVPGNDSLYVFSLFHGEAAHDVIAYILPIELKNPGERHWLRYTLNREVPTLLIESMTRATFLTAVALDLWDLAVRVGVVEEEEEEEEEPPAGGGTLHAISTPGGSSEPSPSVS
jgi:hypothetical protein